MSHQLFPLGRSFITPGALAACLSFPMTPDVLILRHATGDWSDMSREDRQANLRAIQDDSRVLSAFQLGEHRFFVITEADRSTTTVLLASEY